jgi:hypothetical protein
MMRSLPNVISMVALGLLLGVPGTGRACVTDAECDNGDVCSVPDTCVSGSCQLGGGGDTNDDLVCDAELDPNTTINLTRIGVHRNNLVLSDASRCSGAGDLFTSGTPSEAFTGEDGVSIRVKDTLSEAPPAGDGVDATETFLPDECVVKSAGTISCRTADRRSYAKFKPNKIIAGQYKFSYKLKGLGNLTGPFFGPVRMVLTHSGNKRVADTIVDCKLVNTGLRCREF